MAQTPETHTDIPITSGAAAQSKAAKPVPDANGEAKLVEREKRSFAEPAAAPPASAQTPAGQVAQDLAGAAASASRRLVESGRQASHEVADFWRTTLEPLPALQAEMNRTMEAFWRSAMDLGGFAGLRAPRSFLGLAPELLFGQPPADLKATDKAYELSLEAPGLKLEDLEVAIEGDALVVKGHKADARDETTGAYRLTERRFGQFERRFALTPDIDRKKIDAAYRDGVLTITMPRHSDAHPARSRIEITH